MVRTKMIARIVQDQRRQAARARARAKPAAAVRPSGQRRVPRQRIRVNNIKGRIRNRTFKIKSLLAQPKNVDVKKRGVVVRKMVVRRILYRYNIDISCLNIAFPAEVRRYIINNVQYM